MAKQAPKATHVSSIKMRIKRQKNSNYSVSLINSHKNKITSDNTSSDTCLPDQSTSEQYKTRGEISEASAIAEECINNKHLLLDWGLTFNLRRLGRNISISSWTDTKENSAYKETKYKLSLYRKRSYRISISGKIPGIEINIPSKELPGRSKIKYKLTLRR